MAVAQFLMHNVCITMIVDIFIMTLLAHKHISKMVVTYIHGFGACDTAIGGRMS